MVMVSRLSLASVTHSDNRNPAIIAISLPEAKQRLDRFDSPHDFPVTYGVKKQTVRHAPKMFHFLAAEFSSPRTHTHLNWWKVPCSLLKSKQRLTHCI
jgi:hypothetical protein